MLTALLMLTTAHLGGDKMQIKDLTVGKGELVQNFDLVTVDYTGKLTNGTVFDSSSGKAPLVFQIGIAAVIKGWEQGIVGMRVGGKRELTVPPDLGYGNSAYGPIPAKSTLKFEVTVVKTERVSIAVTSPGTGEPAKVGDTVELNYTGTFPDGKKFDSTLDKGRTPIIVPTGRGGMIPGFVQGLIGLHVGEKRKFSIPPSLAYGERGRPPEIPGNSTLVFEIEALRIYPQKK